MPLRKAVFMMIECIREGFNVANRNLHLVLLRIAVAIINILSFFVFMGAPIAVAVAYMGFDPAHASDLLPYLADNPFEFVSRYLGLVFIIGAAFIFYLTFASTLFLYALGGTLGVLRNSALDMQYGFSFSSFFKEANGNFFRLFRLVSLLFALFTILLVAFIVSGGIVAAAARSFTGAGSTLEVFFSSFALVSIIVFTILVFLTGAVVSVYSMAASVLERKGAVDSVKSVFVFLSRKPGAFLFYIILLAGIVAANLAFFILRVPFSMVPELALMMNIALSLMNVVFQGYLVIVMWSSLMVYYIKNTKSISGKEVSVMSVSDECQ